MYFCWSDIVSEDIFGFFLAAGRIDSDLELDTGWPKSKSAHSYPCRMCDIYNKVDGLIHQSID